MNARLNKWLILSVAIFMTVGLVWYPLNDIVNRDSTGITLAIMAIFIIAHFGVAKLISNPGSDLEARLWYTAEALVAIGMIGTVVGFIMLFGEAFASIDVDDPASIAAVLTDMASGMGTALVTTLFGLVSSFTLKGELVFIVGDEND